MINILAILSNTTFLIGVFFLCWFTYQDYKHSKIENQPILTFFIIAVVFSYIHNQLLLDGVLMALFFGMSLLLWNRGVFGGGDTKLFPCIVPFLDLMGVGEVFGGAIRFMIIFGIIGTIYGFTAKFLLKKDYVPFLPAILLSYLVFWLPKLG